MKTKSTSTRCQQGFSLFEMLVVICLLGIMVAIVVPTLTSSSQYEAARNRRNAQEMTAICSAAAAAGVNLVVPGDLERTIRNVLNGGSPEEGPFKGRSFRAAGLSEPDAMKAINYLQLQGGSLLYQAGSM